MKDSAVAFGQLLIRNSGLSLCKFFVHLLTDLQFLFVLLLLNLLLLLQCSRAAFHSFLFLILSILLAFPSQLILFLLLLLLLSVQLLCHSLLLEVQRISILLEVSGIDKGRVDDFD